MIHVTYTLDGIQSEYEFEDARLDEILERADARFCRPLTWEDRQRFAEILNRDEKRRTGK